MTIDKQAASTIREELISAEHRAYEALMNDPAVIADPCAAHTPALWDEYLEAAAAICEYRKAIRKINQ